MAYETLLEYDSPNYDFDEDDFPGEAFSLLNRAPEHPGDSELGGLLGEVREHFIRSLVAKLDGEESGSVTIYVDGEARQVVMREVEEAMAFRAAEYYNSVTRREEMERLFQCVGSAEQLYESLPSEIYQ